MIGKGVVIALWLIVASAFDIAISRRIGILGAQPDLTLVLAVIFSTCVPFDAAALIGFFVGILHSSAVNEKRFAFVVAGIAACMTATKICSRAVEATPMTIAVVSSVCTVVGRVILLFIGLPTNPDNIFSWLLATIAAAIYNGIIAVPAFMLFRRLSHTLMRV